MMPRKSVKEVLSGISTKQKVIAVVLVIMVFFIVWQVIGLFGKGGKPIPSPMTMTKQNLGHPQAMQMTSPNPVGGVPGGAMVNAVPPPPVQVEPRPTPTQEDSALIKLQQQTQAKYIAALNELQMLKIQREIAETNQAITSAKLATVTSEKGITDLLTAPAVQSQPAVNFGAYANRLASPVPTGGEVVVAPAATIPPVIQRPAPVVVETPYVVISVSMQLGTWRAVIGYQGKLFSVTVGDVLPVDGAKIVSISRRGVELRKDGKTRRVPITSVI